MSEGISLATYKDVDHLKITIVSVSYQKIGSHYAYRMAQPSRNIDVSILYPSECDLEYAVFLVDENNIFEDDGQGYLRVIYKGWALPENGLTWKLSPRDKSVSEKTDFESPKHV